MQRRTQFLLSSIGCVGLLPFLTSLSSRYSISLMAIFLLWLIIGTFVLTYVIEKKYRFPEQLMFAILPLLALVSVILIYAVTGFAIFEIRNLLFILFAGFAIYTLLLVLNVINAATVRTVPLLKAAQTTLLGFSVLLMIVWAVFILTFIQDVWLASWIWFMFSYLLSLAVVYLGQVEVVREFTGVLKLPLIESLVIAFLQAFTIYATNGWLVAVPVRGIYWVISLFIMIVLFKARRQRKLTKKMVRDFTLIQWAVFVVVLISGIKFG